ncbi:TPA: ATP-binding cassette domain-containing protein [Yersinia enterocolitica]|nr:ATP-binding cassette domain-containing protein [Yersinia enterocolitica]HED5566930.1 ATP-binding cassette domain-containing protein [Yersinia enterocolitica]
MIELQHISKTFERKGIKLQALNDVNLTVEDGDIFGIIGYSGAGKSTLLRMVNSLESPTAGNVIIDGKNLHDFSQEQLRLLKKNIGMIFQNFNLLESKTVFTNVAMPFILLGKNKKFIQVRVAELLDFVGLGDKSHSFPNELSGGQKQRVGIARALATNPSILLCDEATSSLDPQTTAQILLLLKKINQQYNITVLLITHEMSVIQKICNKVAVMENGQIIEQGSVLSVFGHPTLPTTINFVRTVIKDSLPESVKKLLDNSHAGRRFRLAFVGAIATQPVINQLIRKYDIGVNILFANMSEIQDTTLGHMVLLLTGENHTIDSAVNYLAGTGIDIQEIN